MKCIEISPSFPLFFRCCKISVPRYVAQETQRLEIIILAPRSAVQLPLHARSSFASPGLHARSPLSRPPSRERSLPRLLSFPRADREKEGSSLLTRKVRKVGSAPARRLRSLRSPPPRDDISGKTELVDTLINLSLPSSGAVERRRKKRTDGETLSA